MRLSSFYSAKQKEKMIFICNDKLVLTYLASNAASIPFDKNATKMSQKKFGFRICTVL